MKPPWIVLAIALLFLAGTASGAGITLTSVETGSPEYHIGEEVVLILTVDAASPVNRVDLVLEGPSGILFSDQRPVEFTLVSERTYRGFYRYVPGSDLLPGTYRWTGIRVARTGQDTSAFGNPTSGPHIQLSKTNNEYSGYYRAVEFELLPGSAPVPVTTTAIPDEAVIPGFGSGTAGPADTGPVTPDSGILPETEGDAPGVIPDTINSIAPLQDIPGDSPSQPQALPDLSFPAPPDIPEHTPAKLVPIPTTGIPAGEGNPINETGYDIPGIPDTPPGTEEGPRNETGHTETVPVALNGSGPASYLPDSSVNCTPGYGSGNPATGPEESLPGTVLNATPGPEPYPALNVTENPLIVPNSPASRYFANLSASGNRTALRDGVNVSALQSRQLGNTTGLSAIRDRVLNSFGGVPDSESVDEQTAWADLSNPRGIRP